MKLFIRLICVWAFLSAKSSQAQCGVGYTAVQVNWDVLDFYYVSTGAPYGNGSGVSYVTAAMAANQRFAIGKNTLNIATGANITIGGENTTNTGEAGSYGTGADIQFTTTTNNTTITLTFTNPVPLARFSLYDVDNNQRITVNAKNAGGIDQLTTMALANGGSGITFTGNPGANPRANGIGGGYNNNDNNGAVNVQSTGSVKTITITTSNATGEYWISDITACEILSWPTNYHQFPATEPFAGQPDYFITTPDNNSIYMVNPTTGQCYFLFTDPANNYVNAFAYSPVSHVLYYVTDGTTPTSNARNNKTLKKYDFNTETISVVLADMTATLNIPTFEQGVESAAAAFYDGYLFFGIEGGRFGSGSTRESIIYRFELDAGGVPINACQVFGMDAYNTATNNPMHDWGDFVAKDGMIIDFNVARQSGPTWPNSAYHHFNLTTTGVTTYTNPTPASPYSGQAGLDWNGNLYTLRNTIQVYNGNGTHGPTTPLTTVTGPAWVGTAGDASEPFRPRMDFGDAPASYDPVSGDPAVHERDINLRLGASFDREWVKTGATILADSDGADEDGLPVVSIFNASQGSYLTEVDVYNNTGADARVCAWLDYDGDGLFETSEGLSIIVPHSGTVTRHYLYWPGITSPLINGTYTYLRIRVAPASSTLSTATPVGYLSSGEVEDYRVPVNNFPLNIQLKNFEAQLTSSSTVKLTWSVLDESEVASYTIERSADRYAWQQVTQNSVAPGQPEYATTDNKALNGTSYYRLRIVSHDGKTQFSEVRRIDNNGNGITVSVLPNPMVSKGSVHVRSFMPAQEATLQVIDAKGAMVYSEKIVINEGANNYELPVKEKLSSGRYLVRINTAQQLFTKNLIVK